MAVCALSWNGSQRMEITGLVMVGGEDARDWEFHGSRPTWLAC